MNNLDKKYIQEMLQLLEYLKKTDLTEVELLTLLLGTYTALCFEMRLKPVDLDEVFERNMEWYIEKFDKYYGVKNGNQ
jgi:hypothetical protein